MAVRQPELVKLAVKIFGASAIAVAIDARDNRVAVEGWEKSSSREALEFAKRPATTVSSWQFTDIARWRAEQRQSSSFAVSWNRRIFA
jgi:phosphoribosylformimino-5-aminoimidazole carboxamide ribotide isomerase